MPANWEKKLTKKTVKILSDAEKIAVQLWPMEGYLLREKLLEKVTPCRVLRDPLTDAPE